VATAATSPAISSSGFRDVDVEAGLVLAAAGAALAARIGAADAARCDDAPVAARAGGRVEERADEPGGGPTGAGICILVMGAGAAGVVAAGAAVVGCVAGWLAGVVAAAAATVMVACMSGWIEQM
jgi:hypothetical protein